MGAARDGPPLFFLAPNMNWRRFREVLFLVVGISTPVGVLGVNASAFVMRHLGEFRFGIAACALISGLSLNGLGAWLALTRAQRHAPLVYAEYRKWLIAAAVVYVLAWSGFGAYGTYYSMEDPNKLPNTAAVLTAIALLLLPFGITFLSRRLNLVEMEEKEEQRREEPRARRARASRKP